MARTYDDLLKFQAMYGIPPEKSAGAFGVPLPSVSKVDFSKPGWDAGETDPDFWAKSPEERKRIKAAQGFVLRGHEANGDEYWSPPDDAIMPDGKRYDQHHEAEDWGPTIARPPLPPAPEPVLVAGNEKKPTEGMLDAPPVAIGSGDAIGAPVPLSASDPRAWVPGHPAIVPVNEGPKIGDAGRPMSSVLANAFSGDAKTAKPGLAAGIKKAIAGDKAAQDSAKADLEAAQALEANALGAGAPRRATGLSANQAMSAVDANPALNRTAHEQQMALDDAVTSANAGVFDAKADAATRVGRAFATLAGTDRNAAAAEDARLRAEEARQAQAEKEIRDAEARIMAKPKDGDKFIGMLGSLFSYALAAIGNAKVAGAGGTPTNTIQAMMAREDANEDKEYQRKLERLKSLKIDASQKDAKVRQLEADKVAAYARRRENAIQAFQGVYARNEANLTDAQKSMYLAQIDSLTGQKETAFNQARKDLADKIRIQSAQAANQGGALRGESNQKALAQFVPTGAGGRGYVAIGDDAKGIRERMQWAQAMDQNLANVHQGLERWKAMGASRLDPTDPKRIALENDIKGEMTAYTKNLSNAQKQGVVREWEQNDDHMKDATALMSNLARGDAYAEAAIENAKLMRRRLAGQVDAVARVSKAYDAQRATAPDGTAAIIPLGAGSDAAPLAGVPGLKR